MGLFAPSSLHWREWPRCALAASASHPEQPPPLVTHMPDRDSGGGISILGTASIILGIGEASLLQALPSHHCGGCFWCVLPSPSWASEPAPACPMRVRWQVRPASALGCCSMAEVCAIAAPRFPSFGRLGPRTRAILPSGGSLGECSRPWGSTSTSATAGSATGVATTDTNGRGSRATLA